MEDISNYPIQRDDTDVRMLIQLVELEEAIVDFKKFLRDSEELLKQENAGELAKFILKTRLFSLEMAAKAGPVKEGGNNTKMRMNAMRKMGELLIQTIDENPGAIDMETIMKAPENEASMMNHGKQLKEKMKTKKKPPSMFGKSLGFESEE